MIENELPTPFPLPHGVYVFFQLFNVRSHCSSISVGSCAYSYAAYSYPQDTQLVTVVFFTGGLISLQRTWRYSLKRVVKKNILFQG